jgi:hypothetical protein
VRQLAHAEVVDDEECMKNKNELEATGRTLLRSFDVLSGPGSLIDVIGARPAKKY